jgi:hypothetical protein
MKLINASSRVCQAKEVFGPVMKPRIVLLKRAVTEKDGRLLGPLTRVLRLRCQRG